MSDLDAIRAEFKALVESWEYAFAMGHGCTIGDHPESRAVRQRAAELKAHMASWEYAFAMAATPSGGGDHPMHARTRRRTEALSRRCRDLRAQVAEHELDEI